MCGTDRGKLAVDLDKPDEQGHALKGLATVRSMGKLVQVVPNAGKLTQQLRRHPRRISALPQAQAVEGLSASAPKA